MKDFDDAVCHCHILMRRKNLLHSHCISTAMLKRTWLFLKMVYDWTIFWFKEQGNLKECGEGRLCLAVATLRRKGFTGKPWFPCELHIHLINRQRLSKPTIKRNESTVNSHSKRTVSSWCSFFSKDITPSSWFRVTSCEIFPESRFL